MCLLVAPGNSITEDSRQKGVLISRVLADDSNMNAHSFPFFLFFNMAESADMMKTPDVTIGSCQRWLRLSNLKKVTSLFLNCFVCLDVGRCIVTILSLSRVVYSKNQLVFS